MDERFECWVVKSRITSCYHLVNATTKANEVENFHFFWAKIHLLEYWIIFDAKKLKVFSLIFRLRTEFSNTLKQLALIAVVRNFNSTFIIDENIGKSEITMCNTLGMKENQCPRNLLGKLQQTLSWQSHLAYDLS